MRLAEHLARPIRIRTLTGKVSIDAATDNLNRPFRSTNLRAEDP